MSYLDHLARQHKLTKKLINLEDLEAQHPTTTEQCLPTQEDEEKKPNEAEMLSVANPER